MRAIVGQTRRSFDLRRVFTERKILLVSLSKGLLGPETSALLGSLVVSQLWQAILGRAAIEPERRHPVFVYVDEFQDYLNLPLSFADALTQARGLGVGFIAAHQYLHQLDPAMRSAVLANTQSRVAFRLPSEDARTIAADSALTAEDFQSLGAFQCYVQLVAKAAVQPWCSAVTAPPGLPISDPQAVRASSRSNYGVDRAAIEADLHALRRSPRSDADHLAPRRRAPQGGAPFIPEDGTPSYISAKALDKLRERLSERDLQIIRQVGELRLMSARQIQAIHFPDAEHENRLAATRARQRVIERLGRERLLTPLERGIGGVRAGSAGLVLALGPIGRRVLSSGGPRQRAYEPTLRFVDHTIAISQLVVDATIASRDGLMDILELQPEPRCWRHLAGFGGRRLLRPDAYLALGVGGYELRWFVEMDRATESLPVVLRQVSPLCNLLSVG